MTRAAKIGAKMGKGFVSLLALATLWEATVHLAEIPAWLLPAPSDVVATGAAQARLLMGHAAITALEIVLGLISGAMVGIMAGVLLALSPGLRGWLLPTLVISQTLPVFALAPLLVLWFGYGLASKVAMATLIVFFPVALASYDGLRSVNRAWLDGVTLAGGTALGRWRWVVLPAMAPRLATGLRTAAATAPIAAVVGEWVGAAHGLGYLMLQANARSRIDLLFAALILLACLGWSIYVLVDQLLRRLIVTDETA